MLNVRNLSSGELNRRLIECGSRTSGTLQARQERLERFLQSSNHPNNWNVTKAEKARLKEQNCQDCKIGDMKKEVKQIRESTIHKTEFSEALIQGLNEIIHILNQQDEESKTNDREIRELYTEIKKRIDDVHSSHVHQTEMNDTIVEGFNEIKEILSEHENAIKLQDKKFDKEIQELYGVVGVILKEIRNINQRYEELSKLISPATTENILEVSTVYSTDQLNTAIPSMNCNENKLDADL